MPKETIEFFRHSIDEECILEFAKTARSTFITTGPKTAEFEKKFASYLGITNVIGLMSCTHALHLAYLALGIGEGDEVIVPAFTFAATATSVIHTGARPVFVDVDPETGILDPEKVEAAINEQTKAICAVHLYGVMAPMDRFAKLAEKYSLKLVEDAAHSIEARGPGYSPGSLSDAAAFSFYATKNITCGEGGALATRHDNLADAVMRLRTHGMNKNAIQRFSEKYAHYDIDRLGYKCNMTDLQAALLIPQLMKIEKLRQIRKEIVIRYNDAFKKIDGVILPTVPSDHISAYHLYTVRLKNHKKRDGFIYEMINNGVHCSVHYRPLSRLSYFAKRLSLVPEMHPIATSIGDSTITLPLYPSMKDSEVERVITIFKKVCHKILV